MKARARRLRQRVDSLHLRIASVTGLRDLVALPAQQDISDHQWSLLDARLSAASARLMSRVNAVGNRLGRGSVGADTARQLNAALGNLELDTAKAFTFFDTYMDILSQRHAPELGAILAGCDALALQAMRRDHPLLSGIQPPIVFCDRGFGASIIREDVILPDGSLNPVPLIQIPYTRLKQKYNLTSILHEAGHQALSRLGLVDVLGAVLRSELQRRGAPAPVPDLYAMWSSELGPDFWAFCLSGVADAASLRDLFALPPRQALRISLTDPHPPPYLRALLAFDWCRRAWGPGVYDDWQEEWLDLYPLGELPPARRQLLLEARRFIPAVGATLFGRRIAVLGDKAVADLFDLSDVAPDRVRRVANTARTGVLDLSGTSASTQLAAFSMLREEHHVPEEVLDRTMTTWLIKLGARGPVSSEDTPSSVRR